MDVYHIIEQYGGLFYLISFLWAFLEGESFVIFAGAAAFHGHIHLYWLILSAWLGSFCGDQVYFLIGRRFGTRLMKRYPRLAGPVDKALGFLERYHVGFILSFRFIYGIRNVSSFAVGMSGISWPRFMTLNFFAAGLWATCFAGAGFLLGKAFEAVLGDVAQTFGLIMLGIFLIVVSIALWVAKKRKKQTVEEIIAQEELPASEQSPGNVLHFKQQAPDDGQDQDRPSSGSSGM